MKQYYDINLFMDDSKEIKKKLRNMIRLLTDFLVDGNNDEIRKMFGEVKHVRYSIQGYEEDLDIPNVIKDNLINAGYLAALLDISQLYTKRMYIKNKIQETENEKYVGIIFNVLAENGVIMQDELALVVGISTEELEEVISEINN